ncbi:trehalose-6-phosphate synthase [Streptantibioticus silvisoli]|uniref:Trehalose-6-phosphate synthase n=1 Tax=Streptantibioticus silvisoli TaxID=2705255 RepID=A0ABT6VUN4_9ACTN|nr:trehalose-6-phosphate synthase [Streptantibioticus silvisoli]MDI5962186.1 trehalose-6-phosphate synthase [Streptantibioticus silvisoli]
MTASEVFLASKRAAITYDTDPDTGELRPWLAPGGTGNVVAEQAGVLNVSWIASADSEDDRRVAAEQPEGVILALPSGRDIRVNLIRHDRRVFDSVQNHLTAQLLWAANNYGWDKWTEPSFGAETYAAQDDFDRFTRDFADALLKSSAAARDPLYLVHDYQLVGVPAKLRQERPDAPILLFVHIPWPSPDYWRVLPAPLRTGIIEGMLPATTIGFFADRWTRNFLDCVEDLVPDARVDRDRGTVHWRGARTRVRTLPLGYSPLTLDGRAPRLPEGIGEWADGHRLVVHSGRTDPIKNAERAVRAYALAVKEDQRLRDTRMLVRMNPNRLYVPANADYVRRVEAAVADANRELGPDTVRTHTDNDVDHSIACFRHADLLMFNSTVDGQNLSTFEAPLVNQRDADVILSEMCGAAELLGPHCRTVNPFDLHEQARAISAALSAGPAARAASAARRRDAARPWTLEAWVQAQLDALAADHGARHDDHH